MLLVEDDDGDATIVSELLVEAWPVLRIDRATELGEAERRLGAVDCVLLDLGLPDASGLDAVRRVRAIDSEMPVVVLTGDADEQRGVRALAAGAQDYLIKGTISGASLARAIRHSVQRKLAERFERELAVLRVQSAENARVQRGLVPHPLVDDPRISIVSSYRPGNRRQILGGDFFDVVQSADSLHVVIGDVCGRGPDEAALGVELRIAWRTLILAGVPQLALLETLDRLVVQERHRDHIFATVASLRIDLQSGSAPTACSPGTRRRSDPRRRESSAATHATSRRGPPLGVEDTCRRWCRARSSIGDSWTLLLYSDGIYEGRVVGVRKTASGSMGWSHRARRRAGGPAGGEFDPERLIDRVEELNGGPLDDDVALLALKRDGRDG